MSDAAPIDLSGVAPPGASDIISPPLTDPVVAAKRMEDLKADPRFMERVQAKDPAAFTEYTKAWRVAHGLPAEPEPPQGPIDVEKEADARVVAAVQQHVGFYRDRGYSEQQMKEIVGQRFITADERRWHETQWREKSNSPAFMARWNAREPEASAK